MDDKTWLAGKLASSALAERFNTVAENLANVNTPGYKKKEVAFEESLRSALNLRRSEDTTLPMKITDKMHIDPNSGTAGRKEDFQAEEFTDTEGECRLDGNNVEPEIEMAKLAETKMAYNGVLRMMGKRANMIKVAMGGD